MRRNQSHGGFTITRQEVERKIRICQQPIIFPPARQSAKENHWHLVPTYLVLLGSAKIDQIGKVSKFRFKLVDLTERRLMAISNIPGKAGWRSGPGLPQRRPPSSLPGFLLGPPWVPKAWWAALRRRLSSRSPLARTTWGPAHTSSH